MAFDNRKNESGSNAGFRRWVVSLNREELLDAMAFTFKPDNNTPKSSTNAIPIGFSSSLDGSSSSIFTGVGRSHEYELLLSMVQLQPPPPTPVHPRATGYKSRSQKGARLDYFYKEEEYLRWTKPRLFQWTAQEIHYQYPSLRGRFRNGNRNRRNNNNNNNNPGNANGKQSRFSVIARQKVAPWGDVYSLGCTQEQIDEDVKLIRGTRLGRHRKDGMYHATACFVCSGEGRDFIVRDTATGPNIDSKYFQKVGGNGCNDSTAASILKMLQVASRGQFFPHSRVPNPKTTATTGVPYCATWLQPTERWFSLGMYLASRFQIALWDSYQMNCLNQRRQKQQHAVAIHPGRSIRQGGNWHDYKESMFRDALIRAIRSGLQDTLKQERLDYLRDGTLWSMLECNPNVHGFSSLIKSLSSPAPNDDTKGYWKNLAHAWTQIGLVEAHNFFNSRFKRLVSDKLEKELVAQMERIIFEQDTAEMQSTRSTAVTGACNSKKKRKKAKRKKNKGGNGSTEKAFQESSATPINSTVPFERIGESGPVSGQSDGDNSSSGEDENRTKDDSMASCEFPMNSTTARERNRNIVFVRGILEDITENVFAEAGLKATPKFHESVENVVNTQTSRESSPEYSIEYFQNLAIQERHSFLIWRGHKYSKTKDLVEASTDISSINQPSRNASFGLMQRNFFLADGGSVDGSVDDFKWDACIPSVQSEEGSRMTKLFESQNVKTQHEEDGFVIWKILGKDPLFDFEEMVADEKKLWSKNFPAVAASPNRGNASPFSNSNHDSDLDLTQPSIDEDEDVRELAAVVAESNNGNDSVGTLSSLRTPTLQAPITPPPTLSPITSLTDLKEVKQFPSLDLDSTKLLSGHGSLPPNSPGPKDAMVGDLHSKIFRDDHHIKNENINRRSFDMPTYKSVAVKTLGKPSSPSLNDVRRSALNEANDAKREYCERLFLDLSRRKQDQRKEPCAQSETAVDPDQRENQEWIRPETDNYSLAKDETTTIISGISHRVEAEELADVQEERNHFRDLCLTLGAEVAKRILTRKFMSMDHMTHMAHNLFSME